MAAAVRWPSESEADVEHCVRLALRELDTEPALQAFLLDFLQKPGRLLGPTDPQWPKFVLETCSALGGDSAAAAWAAAAVEFAVTAIDVADDLADGDLVGDREATIRAPSAALALGWLAQHCCARTAEAIGFQRAHRLSLLLATGSLASCAGQDRDMLMEAQADVSEESAAKTSWRKSGALAAMACTVGAACSTDSMDLITAAGRFGSHAGMVAQLVNDIDGILKAERGGSADIFRRKKTLPVAYALTCAREESIGNLTDWYGDSTSQDATTHREVAQTIRDLGSLHYTWAVAEIHSKQAMDAVRELSALTGSNQAFTLRRLVPSLQPD